MENNNMEEQKVCGCGCGHNGCWRHKHHKCHRRGHGGCMGAGWFVGWLFTIGWLQLAFWKGVLALVVWPYYIGVAIRALK